MTRNQIRKQQYILRQQVQELLPLITSSDASKNDTPEYRAAIEQARLLDQENEELEIMLESSRDEDEPQQETYVPSNVTGKIPLLILLHGQGWTGGSQVEIWQPLAERERLALLAPTSLSANRDWGHRNDYATLVSRQNLAVSTMPVDTCRIYLVGHSIGGKRALRMGLVTPNLFAAMALHSPSDDYGLLQDQFPKAQRKLPARVWTGTQDVNKGWAASLQRHYQQHPEAASVELDVQVLANHQHSDYNTRDGLLDEIWNFLKGKSL